MGTPLEDEISAIKNALEALADVVGFAVEGIAHTGALDAPVGGGRSLQQPMDGALVNLHRSLHSVGLEAASLREALSRVRNSGVSTPRMFPS